MHAHAFTSHGAAGHWYNEASSHDIGQFSTALKDFVQEYDQVEAGEFSGNLQDVMVHGVRLFRERMSLPVAQHVHMPDGLLNILVPLSLTAGPTKDQTRALSADCISLMPQNQDMYLVGSHNTDYVVVSVEEEVLLRRLCSADQLDLLAARRNYSLMVSPQHIHQLRRRLPALLNEQLQAAATLPAADMKNRDRALEYQLLDTVFGLMTQYDSEGQEVKWRVQNRQHQFIVRESHRFVTSSEGAEASILDVCRVLNIPRRTLNYSFQKVTGMSPVSYLRSVKLNSARRDIQKTDEAIGDIAARYGFFHAGYFGQEYRKLFGECPTETRSARTVISLF